MRSATAALRAKCSARAFAALVAFALASCWPAQARAQGGGAASAAEIDRVLARKESKWQCGALRKGAAVTAARAPRGDYYELRCRRGDMIVVGLVFFAESAQDAARRLERSLKDPQVFQGAPEPLAGLGEQAYEQRRPGAASVAFRRATLFAQVSVGVVPSEKGKTQARPEKVTAEAAKVARRFAGHLAGEKETK